MEPLRCLAPAKINVCLFVGRPPDARAEQLAPAEWRALQAELAR